MKKLLITSATLAILAGCGGSNSSEISGLAARPPSLPYQAPPSNTAVPTPTYDPRLDPSSPSYDSRLDPNNPNYDPNYAAANVTPTPSASPRPPTKVPNSVGRVGKNAGDGSGGTGSGGNGTGGNGAGGGNNGSGGSGGGAGGSGAGGNTPNRLPGQATPYDSRKTNIIGTRNNQSIISTGELGGINSTIMVPQPPMTELQQAQTMVGQIGNIRSQHRLNPLAWDDSLSALAQQRAQEIANGRNSIDVNSYGFNEQIVKTIDSYQQIIDQNMSSHSDLFTNTNVGRVGIGHATYRHNNVVRHVWAFVYGAGQGRALPGTSGNGTSPYSYTRPTPVPGPSVAQVNAALIGAYTANDDRLVVNRETVSLPNGQSIQLAQPASLGLSQQTIGSIKASDGKPLGYVNIGKPFEPANDAYFRGTYRGKSVGDINGVATTADVQADVNFYDSNKNLALRTTNTRKNGQPSFDLNFTDSLNWNAGSKQFQGQSGNFARFYGAAGQEVGGQFNRVANGAQYRGAYGAVKTN